MSVRAWVVRNQDGSPFRVPFIERWLTSDKVFYTDDVDAEYVRRSLIDHDGYPESIRVYPERAKRHA